MGSMGAAAMIVGHPDRETVVLIRAASGAQNAYGGFDAETPTEISMSAVVHPVAGEDLVQVPEADRVASMIEIYSTQSLRVAREGVEADRIRHDSKTYRVVTVNEQRAGGVWLAFAALEEP